jgi:hypothetical protein
MAIPLRDRETTPLPRKLFVALGELFCILTNFPDDQFSKDERKAIRYANKVLFEASRTKLEDRWK